MSAARSSRRPRSGRSAPRPIESIGSTLPSIIPSAISGSLRYQRDGLIHWRVVLWTALVGCTAAVAGALLSDVVPGDGHLLMLLTAALLGFTAYRTGRSPQRPDPADAEEPDPRDGPGLRGGGCLRRHDAGGPDARGLVAAGHDRARGRAAERPARRRRWDRDGPALRQLGPPADQGSGRVLARVRRDPRGPGDDHPCVARAHRLGVRAPPLHRRDPRRAVGAHLAIRSSERTLRLSVAIVLGTIAVIYAVGEITALL